MTPIARDSRADNIFRIGSQPIALAAATLLVMLAGIITIALGRTYSGVTPESDHGASARQLQARTAQVSEQLVEKAKGLEATQQESIDQLQMVQDQLQTVRRLLAAQQADTRRLSEQVSTLTGAVDGLRRSYASTQGPDPLPPPRNRHNGIIVRDNTPKHAKSSN